MLSRVYCLCYSYLEFPHNVKEKKEVYCCLLRLLIWRKRWQQGSSIDTSTSDLGSTRTSHGFLTHREPVGDYKASFILRTGTHREGMQPDNKRQELNFLWQHPLSLVPCVVAMKSFREAGRWWELGTSVWELLGVHAVLCVSFCVSCLWFSSLNDDGFEHCRRWCPNYPYHLMLHLEITTRLFESCVCFSYMYVS